MWKIAQIAIISIVSAYILYSIYKQKDKALKFVMFAIWLRLVLSALPDITYPPFFAGLSINALASIAVSIAGLMLLPPLYLLIKPLMAFYVLIAVIIISAALNGMWAGMINVFLKWLYFLIICLLIYDAMSRNTTGQVFKPIAITFALPIILQLASLFLNYAKANESDGSASYIGGYNHEAAFSMILVAYLYLILLTPQSELKLKWLWSLIGVFGLLVANYRTCMLAVIPAILTYFFTVTTQRLDSRDKIIGVLCFILIVSLAGVYAFNSFGDRFSDISNGISKISALLVEPQFYSDAERQLLSSRAYIWSQYITQYIDFNFLEKIIGRGPESWSTEFEKYAHNVFISYLYEYGIVGLTAIATIFIVLFVYCICRWQESKASMLFSVLIGYVLMCMSTMPLWNIEGLIGFAVIVAYAFDGRRRFFFNKATIKSGSYVDSTSEGDANIMTDINICARSYSGISQLQAEPRYGK